ncbi:hypothetical protein [Wolbachia endosymbiont (group E) of Neria commutata]|uniref:hypothetical protein n=1 Tax=Wolbachia endosymbiont (group E) of Neria commutata TaxID=3066149 RepID=UPI003132BA58
MNVYDKLSITSIKPTGDEIFSRLGNGLYELRSEYLDKLDTLSSDHKIGYNNLFAEYNDRTHKFTSEFIEGLDLSVHYPEHYPGHYNF